MSPVHMCPSPECAASNHGKGWMTQGVLRMIPTPPPPPQGWQCPVCSAVWAPTVPQCTNSHTPPPTYSTGTGASE